MNEDSDTEIHFKKKRTTVFLDDSSSSDDSSFDVAVHRKKKAKNYIPDSESESDSSIEYRKKKRVARLTSDASTSSSGSIIVKKPKKPRPVSESSSNESDGGFEGSSCEWESDVSFENEPQSQAKPNAEQDAHVHSDSSDDQAEKCPICLLTFKQQEVGTPESCDHTFCVECIQEWSRNMNTCPVDRQPFTLILVRQCINGKVTREIHVEPPAPPQELEILEDPTYCEICGSCDREDRMLLCDGCDLGYHLECLDPPLDDIPEGSWYCDGCTFSDDTDIGIYEVHLLLDDAETVGFPQGPRRRPERNDSNRMVPRTRHSERVRQRIADNRNSNNTRRQNPIERPSTSSGIEDFQPGPSGRTRNCTTSTPRKSSKQKRKRKKKSKRVSYRKVYQKDRVTGETVAVMKTVQKKRKPRGERDRARRAAQPTTTKKRLAHQLGICKPQISSQLVPELKVQQTHSHGLGVQRHNAGIPTLHLFGQQNELDYFSNSEGDYDESDVIIRRRPNLSDAALMRRRARRKAITVPTRSVASTHDLLSSILDSQTKLHSRNSVLSVSKDGTLQVGTTNGDNNRVNVNTNNVRYRQMPSYQNGTPSDSTTSTNTHGSTNSSPNYRSYIPTSTVSTSSGTGSISGDADFEGPHDYSQSTMFALENREREEKSKEEDNPKSGNNSDSEVDIYSDIETVSTSKVDEEDAKPVSPAVTPSTLQTLAAATDEDNNDSDAELIIDTEKTDTEKCDPSTSVENEVNTKEETVSSTVDSTCASLKAQLVTAVAHSTSDIQSEDVHSSANKLFSENPEDDEDDDDNMSEDGCPNFSIYSTESINLAKTTDLELLSENSNTNELNKDQVACSEVSSTPLNLEDSNHPEEIPKEAEEIPPLTEESKEEQDTTPVEPSTPAEPEIKEVSTSPKKAKNTSGGLYSDSEDEVRIDIPKPFGIGDIRNMTEDISEEERSYTPCLDEKEAPYKEGLDGLDTEMISDEDRNDFDESHELKTVSDGDALEINAKESELDFTKPDDYEEGEIIDKARPKTKKPDEAVVEAKTKEPEAKKKEPEAKKKDLEPKKKESEPKKSKKKDKDKDKEKEKDEDRDKEKEDDDRNKENENQNKDSSFKKLSKSNKDRNYRDKDKARSRSKSKDKKDKESKKDKRKERRKELERYSVRTIIKEKPRPMKDKFGRDLKQRSSSRSSRSQTPVRSPSRSRRSHSRERSRKRRGRSRDRRSLSRSRSRSVNRRRFRSVNARKRRRSSSRRRKSRDRSRVKDRRDRSRSRRRTRTPSPKRRRERRNWTPSVSRSRSPELPRHMSPSWTPPHLVDQSVNPHNLTVILTNDSNKKKKEKRKRADKRGKEGPDKQKRRRHDKTPPLPSKEVFASGDNILVSVNFNKDTDNRDVTTKRKRDAQKLTTKKSKKDKRARKRNKDVSGIKPVAIIDLDRSPFKEITPSPKDIIVLSDSDNAESNDLHGLQTALCDSSQQVASPEHTITGPKTPPEPQVKFTLNAKAPQMRVITNPLHEPDEVEEEIDPQEQLEQRLNEVVHKGPNTPPEPPNSPPSSPDAYDPFDPTKSRSPTPEPMMQNTTQSNSVSMDDNRDDSMMEARSVELVEKSSTPVSQQTPDALKSHTPPAIETQPDSQNSVMVITPDTAKSSEIPQISQSQSSVFPTVVPTKAVAPTIPYPTQSLVTSTPISANLTLPRINILSSTILTPSNTVSSVPQRIVLPNTIKSSPVKVAPSKPIKSTPIKPMPTKNIMTKQSNQKPGRKSTNRGQNSGDSSEIINLDFDSPYSPGSSDYEDLFEPPAETNNKSVVKPQSKPTKSPAKVQNAFDSLFGSSPIYNNKKPKMDNKSNKMGKKMPPFNSSSKGKRSTKLVGVKLDEDNLKILDELPNSAVEMQVKDKFLKKLNRQERVVEEVKLVLKPHYNKKRVNKEEYKDILRRAVPKICHNKSGEINPKKIQNLIEAYVRKVRRNKKVTSTSVNSQKT